MVTLRYRFNSILGVLCLLVLATGCTAQRPDSTDYNIVLIVLDTLRADYLSCYNENSPARTPHLDRLAKGGVLFSKAYTTVPFTLPAHASLMTSRYPAQLGVRRNGRRSMAPEETTLAEIFQSRDYVTGAVISAFPVASAYGMNQGFEYYGEDFLKLSGPRANWSVNLNSRRNGTDVNKEVFRWLDNHHEDQFFLWVHYYDSHSPFNDVPDAFRLRYPQNPYAGAVEYLDQSVGDLLSRLRELDLLDKTLIVILSDHGEGLGDHKEMGHALFVYNSTIHIPLIIYGKNLIPHKEIEAPVSILDVAPTLLSLLEFERPSTFEGTDLTPYIFDKTAKPDPDRLIYSETLYPFKAFGWSPLYSLTNSSWKFIDAPRPELYNVANDFSETRNLFQTERDIADELKAELDSMIVRQGEKIPKNRDLVIDPKAIERLKSLGYVATGVEFKSSSGIDPKDRIDIYEAYIQGIRLIEAGEYQKAIEILRQLVQVEKKNPDFLCYLGVSLFRNRNYAKAEEVLGQALELDSDFFYAVQTLADVYEAQKQYDKSIEIFRKYITKNPSTLLYQYELWNFYIRIGQWEKALSEMKTALERHPRNLKLELNIAKLLSEHEHYEEALAVYQRILERKPFQSDGVEGVAKTLLLLGRHREAEKAYLEIIGDDPENYEAHLNLGMIYSKLGRFTEGVASCRRALDLQPDNPVIQFDYGYLLLLNGQLDSAVQEFEKALVMDPSNWKVHMALGVWFKEHGRLEEARTELEKGLEISPENEMFLKLLQETKG